MNVELETANIEAEEFLALPSGLVGVGISTRQLTIKEAITWAKAAAVFLEAMQMNESDGERVEVEK
jgi:hypothetical protein